MFAALSPQAILKGKYSVASVNLHGKKLILEQTLLLHFVSREVGSVFWIEMMHFSIRIRSPTIRIQTKRFFLFCCWESKKRKLEHIEPEPQKRKKFKIDTNPNVQSNLIQRYIGSWKKQKTAQKYEQKFVNQYGSNFDWNSRAHVEVIYREGGRTDLKVYTGLTESGCGVSLGRHYGCWCKEEEQRQAELVKEKEMEKILEKKREAVKAMALRVNKKIHKTKVATNVPATTTATTSTGTRWGPW